MNKEFHCLLVGVDESDTAQRAFHYAVERAKKDQLPLVIASVLEINKMNVYEVLDEDYLKEQRQTLETHIQEYKEFALEQGVTNVTTLCAEGDPAEEIIHTILPKTKADLLIIGSHSYHGIQSYFGSDASYMAKQSPVSLIIIK